LILAATLAPVSRLMTPENAAARRWVPWLCAYTGGRVNEMTQLRESDVFPVLGLPCVRITPEAGSAFAAALCDGWRIARSYLKSSN
jgi:hypothetical protein